MMKSRARAFSIFATVAAFLSLWTGCTKPEEKEPEPVVSVQATPVRKGSIQRIVRAQAILYPINQAAITPKISAPVRQFFVNRGDHVRKGQLLAELENRDLVAAAAEAKGNYDQAEANLRNTVSASLPDEVVKSKTDVQSSREALDAAQRVYESRERLFKEGAIARKLLDEAQLAYVQARNQYEVARKHLESLEQAGRQSQTKAAQAQVEAAQGRKEAAEAQLEYSKIFSPIDGAIADRPIYMGEMASSGTALLTVMDVSSVIARANISIGEIRSLKVGDDATLAASDTPAEVQGKVMVISPALDPNSTTAEVWVRAPNPGGHLHPGATVQIAIIAETIKDALIIPASALLPLQDSGATVLVVGPDSSAHERRIQTGIREGDTLQVLKGLSAGEPVITAGGFGVQEKTKVKVENAKEQNRRD